MTTNNQTNAVTSKSTKNTVVRKNNQVPARNTTLKKIRRKERRLSKADCSNLNDSILYFSLSKTRLDGLWRLMDDLPSDDNDRIVSDFHDRPEKRRNPTMEAHPLNEIMFCAIFGDKIIEEQQDISNDR